MDDQKNKEVIMIIASVVVIILVAYFGISPTIASLKKSNYAVATKGQDLKRAEENLDNLRAMESTFNSKANEVKSLSSALPASADPEDLIATLEAIASRNGMQLLGVTPIEVEAAVEEGAEKLSVGQADFDAAVNGSYQSLQKFMADLETNRRPLNATKLAIVKETGESGASSLSATITLTAYYSLTPAQTN